MMLDLLSKKGDQAIRAMGAKATGGFLGEGWAAIVTNQRGQDLIEYAFLAELAAGAIMPGVATTNIRKIFFEGPQFHELCGIARQLIPAVQATDVILRAAQRTRASMLLRRLGSGAAFLRSLESMDYVEKSTSVLPLSEQRGSGAQSFAGLS